MAVGGEPGTEPPSSTRTATGLATAAKLYFCNDT